jgi:DNA-directed RNA polymerase subunit RPC12/RpoP
MADELVPAVDVSRNTIRGRACPACGGKIIPSNRAVYQSTTAPEDVYPLWECERCGYAELSQKKAPPPKHAPPAKKPAAKPDAEGASE